MNVSTVLTETENGEGSAVEQTLLAQAQQGDRTAFDGLSRLYRPRLAAFCARFLPDKTEGEDAVQETLLLAWRNLDSFRGESAFSTWLFQIARNHCLNRLRGKVRPLSLEDHQLSTSAVASNPAAGIEDQIYSRQLVAAVMARLDERDRIILWLHYQERLTSEEISLRLPATMKITADGVRSRLKRNIRPAIEAVWREQE